MIADALLGIHRALLEYVRREILAGTTPSGRIAAGLKRSGERASALLKLGLD